MRSTVLGRMLTGLLAVAAAAGVTLAAPAAPVAAVGPAAGSAIYLVDYGNGLCVRPNNAGGSGQWLVEVACDADDVFQRWFREPTGAPDTYRFVSAASGYCMAAEGWGSVGFMNACGHELYTSWRLVSVPRSPYYRITIDERGCLTRNVPTERPLHLGTGPCRTNSTTQAWMLLSQAPS